ncbi:cupin domain-containing protein [Ruicaihuangia caeni]|uniref:Cupin domain-containing protein n=1 Tax=Ruicaihuangia caeni TaxID=3042517 RepID=A0AAW6TB94_9MICO|nr:cupin domain-containing protein [Klugiella sp. YN-L-19]MDI2099613.1 cupin domain-containing protein [Klugiella sp. YN-L-19]
MEIVSVELEEDVILPPVTGVRADSDDLAIGTQEFAPGQTMQHHYHRTYREVVVVQSGRITLEIDDQALVLGPGDKCVIAIGSVHGVRNDTDEPAVLTYLKVPFDPYDTIPVER